MTQKHIRFDDELLADIEKIASEKNSNFTQVTNEALKFYRDYHHCQTKATFLNQEVLAVAKSYINVLQTNINNKTNKYLSELAIQSVVTNMLLADNLEVDPKKLNTYRTTALNFISENQRLLRLDELTND